MLLPLLPLAIVLMGFPSWRRICPIAFFGEAGPRARPRCEAGHLRAGRGPGLARALVPPVHARHPARDAGAAAGGDQRRRPLARRAADRPRARRRRRPTRSGAARPGATSSARSVWSSASTPIQDLFDTTTNSQCAQCTACKKHCPDIDQENAYWKDATGQGRRIAFYSFPGLVLAFYVYYWLRAGDWEAYFDGRWTRHPVTCGPLVRPRVLLRARSAGGGRGDAFAAPVLGRELRDLRRGRSGGRRASSTTPSNAGTWCWRWRRSRPGTCSISSPARRRCAGCPTARAPPRSSRRWSPRWCSPSAGGAPASRYIAEQGASRLLRNWEFEEPPPRDAGEVYGWIKASRHAREKDLAAYANTVRDMIADGLVGPGELRLLEGVRRQLGISEREHERILARLSEEERHLFRPAARRRSRAGPSTPGSSARSPRRCCAARRRASSTSCAPCSASRSRITRLRSNDCAAPAVRWSSALAASSAARSSCATRWPRSARPSPPPRASSSARSWSRRATRRSSACSSCSRSRATDR